MNIPKILHEKEQREIKPDIVADGYKQSVYYRYLESLPDTKNKNES